jgi:branched-chain amino acid transport system ATP-binding protein
LFKAQSIERLKESKGRNLSGGEQQMLTISRTVMGNPELILLDEPCEGLASQIEWVEPNALEKSTRKTPIFEKVYEK